MTDHDAVPPVQDQTDLPDWLAEVAGEKPVAESQQVAQRFSTFNVIAGLIIVALLGVTGYALYQRSQSQPTAGPAPDFTVTMYDFDQIVMSGERVSLKDLRGQAVVINFWASFCVPCQKEAPMLERVWNDYRDRGVIFLGINTDDPLKNALDYLVEYQITYPNAPDVGERVEEAYRITGIPETFVINTRGEIVRHFLSEPNERDLRAAIDRALEG
ncbi:MAG: TlpA family protein disulfide reductase [Aggregatilineaceae bacterium]